MKEHGTDYFYVEKLFSDDESANKTVDPPVKEQDITKSGCSIPSISKAFELMEKGYCFENCKFYAPGKFQGDSTCVERLCDSNGGIVTNNNACDRCLLPWKRKDGKFNIIWGKGWQNCGNPDRPCDLCNCEKVDGQMAKFNIKVDECKKPQME